MFYVDFHPFRRRRLNSLTEGTEVLSTGVRRPYSTSLDLSVRSSTY